MPRQILIAATKKSSGKTSLSLGLAEAFTRRGLSVQTFKKGPDYIDPLWLARASGSPCYNLDFNTMCSENIVEKYHQNIVGSDLAIVETNKGLFDGLSTDGSDSNAQLAKLLNIPVILVIDTIGMTRGIAPLLQGYAGFDPNINFAGVILNKTGGPRHEEKLRAAIAEFSDFKVLGAVRNNDELNIDERHLGLTTPQFDQMAFNPIKKLGDIVSQSVDMDALLQLAAPTKSVKPPVSQSPVPDIKIAVARDDAFGFYYPDDLEAFRQFGAELVFFNALDDPHLPECDGLFIGGGFPEVYLNKLQANGSLRSEIKQAIENGLPTYAECGGLMYLCSRITWQGKSAQMVGVINADARMHKKPRGRGYAKLQYTNDHPWGVDLANDADEIAVHEFHYAALENLNKDARFAYKVTRGQGINGTHDGIIKANMVAGFCHFRSTGKHSWVEQFTSFVRSKKKPI